MLGAETLCENAAVARGEMVARKVRLRDLGSRMLTGASPQLRGQHPRGADDFPAGGPVSASARCESGPAHSMVILPPFLPALA